MTHVNNQTNVYGVQPDTPPQPDHAVRTNVALLLRPSRRQVRFGVHGLLTHSPVFGQAVDVSESGLQLESYAALAVGCSYVFRFDQDARFLSLPGKVVWCSLDRFEPTSRGCRAVYRAGIQLEPNEAEPGWRSVLADRAGLALGA